MKNSSTRPQAAAKAAMALSALSQHDPVFRSLAASAAKTMQVNRTSQSFYDYQTDGEFIDFAYMRHGIYALTFEVAHEATPTSSKLQATVKRTVDGSLSFMQAVDDVLSNVCPNCGGGFVPRPIRPSRDLKGGNSLGNDPASTIVRHRPIDPAAHARFAEQIKSVPPAQR